MSITKIFPSLGYFGNSKNLARSVTVNQSIKGLRLALTDRNPEILNLMLIRVYNESGLVSTDQLDFASSQSSCHPAAEIIDPSPLLTGGGIHTARELGPWWQLNFKHDTYISKIEILNRPDRWGSRSNSLKVEILTNCCNWLQIYYGRDINLIDEFITAYECLTNKSFSYNSKCDDSDERHKLLADVSHALMSPSCDIENVDFAPLLQIANIWSEKALCYEEMVLIASMALAEALDNQNMSMIGMSACLKNKSEIKRFSDCINDLSRRQKKGEWAVTRHGVQPSRLISESDEFTNAAIKVINKLKDFGLTPMLAYGTLLGLIRDHSFLPHDDDLDIIYIVNADSKQDATEKSRILKYELEEANFKCTPMHPHGLNMHVQPEGSSVTIDIFPCWSLNGRAYLHMENMRIRDIDSSILLPTKTAMFYSHQFPIPNDSKSFLIERYGENWEHPDPYFEWPWLLEE